MYYIKSLVTGTCVNRKAAWVELSEKAMAKFPLQEEVRTTQSTPVKNTGTMSVRKARAWTGMYDIAHERTMRSLSESAPRVARVDAAKYWQEMKQNAAGEDTEHEDEQAQEDEYEDWVHLGPSDSIHL